MKVYCIAMIADPEVGGASGSLWYFSRKEREKQKNKTGAYREEYFTLKVPKGSSNAEITDLVDHAESKGTYLRDPLLSVDGISKDGTFQGDGKKAPFVVFDIDAQENLPGYYPTREAAEKARKLEIKRRLLAYNPGEF